MIKKYALALSQALEEELSILEEPVNGYQGLVRFGNMLNDGRWSYQSFRRWHENMREVIHHRAHILNSRSEIASEYDDMDSFWKDYDDQVAGHSLKTIWDSYENGSRRLLEKELATIYKTEDALLLNTGMSCLAVALECLELKAGDYILTGEASYFETSEYLVDYIQPHGIQVIRMKMDDKESFFTEVTMKEPKVFLLETVVNAPKANCLRNLIEVVTAATNSVVIIDNTVQCVLTNWFELLPEETHNRILVFESGIKYLTEECSFGVLYGKKTLLDRARHRARSTGQQLQQKAFNFLTVSQIRTADLKMRIHSSNTNHFLQLLKEKDQLFAFVKGLETNQCEYLSDGVGSLIYLQLKEDKLKMSLDQAHEVLVRNWKAELNSCGLDVMIKAGFGWYRSAIRSYASARLNQPDAPMYIRISIGLEPSHCLDQMAQILIKQITNLYSE